MNPRPASEALASLAVTVAIRRRKQVPEIQAVGGREVLVPVGTIKSRMHRARQQARRQGVWPASPPHVA